MYAIEDITSYLDFEDLKNAEEASSEWAEIFLNLGLWGKLLQENVSLCFVIITLNLDT